jgi:P27 family predicted phage terminase small subunit
VGRTAKPAALKLLHGDGNGKDSGGREVNAGPAFKRVPPEPPFWLDGEALAEWNRVVPELTRLDIIKSEDAATLTTYCEMWARFVDATATIAREGMFIEAKQGMLAHPAVGIQRASAKEVRAIAAHFGLTPSTEQALARGAGDDGEERNPFD